uniref:Uncharacterized protein n=1 Tax=Setaria viridis TaxID=4556 RepID=A0A4U6SVM8_SETVI|nr:hypothetical protein SEVIR_9G142275v2 [Setaria viridis]
MRLQCIFLCGTIVLSSKAMYTLINLVQNNMADTLQSHYLNKIRFICY